MGGCGREEAPEVPFAPSGESYASKVDFAQLERDLPLGPTDLMKITPKNLEGSTQEQVDQIYARSRILWARAFPFSGP